MTTESVCACGGVRIETIGAPILHTTCYCNDCQVAGRELEALPGAPSVLDPDGGTDLLLFRRDRVVFGSAEQSLRAYRRRDDSPTRRLVATCCNSAMLLDFQKGHWLSMYRRRLHGDVPPLQMRVCTKSRRSDVELPSDVPNYASHSFAFFAKLIAAWIPMLLRR